MARIHISTIYDIAGDNSDRCLSLEEELTASSRALLPLAFQVQILDLHERCFPLFIRSWLFWKGHGRGGRQCFLALGWSHFDVNEHGLETSERWKQSRSDGEKNVRIRRKQREMRNS